MAFKPSLSLKSRGFYLGIFLSLSISLFAKNACIEIYSPDVGNLDQYQNLFSSLNLEVRECDLSRLKKGKVSSHVKKILFMNLPKKSKKVPFQSLPKDKCILFMWEPPLWQKKMYSPKMQSHFSKMYTWNDDLVDGKTFFKFYYPAKKLMVEDIPPFEEKNFCTLIAGAKSPKVFHFPGELYSERIKAIHFFTEKEKTFAFYGHDWDPTLFPAYKGSISDKIAVNKQYKFTICYENCSNLPGYITEKIFDCFAAGSIPIYWGAPNVEKYIPKGCFIDRRDFASLEELYLFLKKMTQEEYEGYLERIRSFLDSEKAHLFSIEHYKEILLQAIKS